MATRATFQPDEWELLMRGFAQPAALVSLAEPGGALEETMFTFVALSEARAQLAHIPLIQDLLTSLGGVMSDDIGVKAIDKLYHLWGHLDPLHGLGEKLYAGRWKWFPQSEWNQAVAQGKIVFVDMGQMHHNGGTNYFSWTAFTPDGRSHAMATIDMIGEVLVKEGLMDPAALKMAQAATDAEARAYEQARVAEAAAAQRAKKAKKAKAA